MSAPERIWAASVTENYGEWQTTTDGLPRPTEYVRADIVTARIAALEEQLAASTGAVKVKALEWTRGWMSAEAQTEIGQYTITYRRDGSFEWGIGILKGWASSWDEAKAAAQADFERRILSALEATPTAELETENLRLKAAITESQKILCGPQDEMVRIVSSTIVLAQALSSRK